MRRGSPHSNCRRLAPVRSIPFSVRATLAVALPSARLSTGSLNGKRRALSLRTIACLLRRFSHIAPKLLQRYRHDERIMSLSGNNFQRGRSVTPYRLLLLSLRPYLGVGQLAASLAPVRFDRVRVHGQTIAAWACWILWSDGDSTFTSYWTEIFDRCARGKMDVWAYQWTFACWAQQGLTCLPARNLVTNIGFGPSATHTVGANHPSACLPREDLEFPLRHPSLVVRHVDGRSLHPYQSFRRQTILPFSTNLDHGHCPKTGQKSTGCGDVAGPCKAVADSQSERRPLRLSIHC